MKLKQVSGIVLLLQAILYVKNIQAQVLNTGDKYPMYTITNVINYSAPVLRLSDFRGKAVILDFWNTYCSACIQAFPKLDSLQRLYKKDIQIILVNSESREKTEAFFKKHPNILRPGVPMIVGDTKLKHAFPSQGQPYIVWIDKQGVVKNFSNGTNVSKRNLRYFIDGKKLLFRDPTLEKFGPAVEEANFDYMSFISHCYETLNIGNGDIHEINNGKSVTIKNNCSSVVSLFTKAYGEFGKYNFETRYGLRLNVKDSFKYSYPQNLELMDHWLNDNAYNYQLILPRQKIDQAYKIMQEDLARYFDVSVSKKKTPIEGVIICNDSAAIVNQPGILLTKKQQVLTYAVDHPDSVFVFQDESVETIVLFLKSRLSYFFPFVDSVKLPGNISIIFRKSSLRPFNFTQFKEDLNCAGLDCLKKEIEVDVLNIEEISR